MVKYNNLPVMIYEKINKLLNFSVYSVYSVVQLLFLG